MDTIELDPRLRHATTFLGRTPKMLIDGKLVGAASGKTFEVYNPATGAVIANVPEGDKEDVNLAVAAARRAFDSGVWAGVSPSEKGRMLWRLADLIERDLEELAELDRSITASRIRSRGSPICRSLWTCSVIWAAGRPRSAAGRSRGRCPGSSCPTRSRSRSAWSARSSRGTSLC
jgi:phenylacetaldehyde dehydrogenase